MKIIRLLRICSILVITNIGGLLFAAETYTCTNQSFEKLRTLFSSFDAYKMAAQIYISQCDPETIRSSDVIKDYITQILIMIKSKKSDKPQLIHRNDNEKNTGYSFAVLTEQGSVSGEFNNKTNNAFFTIETTNLVDPNKITAFTKKYFKAARSKIVAVQLRK